jgi:hypothetical protein
MNTRTIVLFAAVLSTSAVAAADPVDEPKAWVGLQAEIDPAGTINLSGDAFGAGFDQSYGTQFAYGLGLNFDYQVIPLLSIGFAPRVVFNVNGNNSDFNSAELLDLRLRAAVGKEVMPKLRVYGIGTMGWGVTFDGIPDLEGNTVNFNGFTIGFGGGASYAIAPKLRLFGELTYEFGFENHDDGGEHIQFLDLAFGIAAGLGG